MLRFKIPVLSLLLISLLSACLDDDNTTPPDFNLAFTENPVYMTENSEITLTLELSRKGDFSAPVKVELLPINSFSTSAITFTEGVASASFRLTSSAEAGTHILNFEGSAGQLSHNLPLRVVVQGEQRSASLDNVIIEGYKGQQVRQGASEINLVVTGENLFNLKNFSLDDLPLKVLDSSTSQIVLSTVVPHGVSKGPRTLRFFSDNSELKVLDAVVVTDITVSEEGNDDSGQGTTESPFRSLTKALAFAESGDHIFITAGTYSEASGEDWLSWDHAPNLPGQKAGDTIAFNVPEGVSIFGEGSSTILKGSSIKNHSVGLVFEGNAQLSNVLLQNFEYALLMKTGQINLQGVQTKASAAGLWAYGNTNVTLSDDTNLSATVTALAALNQATLTLNHTQLADALFGLAISNTATVQAENLNIQDTTVGIGTVDIPNVRLNQVTAQNNIIGMSISGGDIRVRNSSFSNNEDVGIQVLTEPISLDLGTSSDAGNNVFEANGQVQILDARPERNDLNGVVIEMSESIVVGDSPLASAYYLGAVDLGNRTLQIVNKNNAVQVY